MTHLGQSFSRQNSQATHFWPCIAQSAADAPFQLKRVLHHPPASDTVVCPTLIPILFMNAAQHKPLGLGSSTLPHQPFSACPRGPRCLRRQWTTAKPAGDVGCNVLPFFLDLSLAFAPGMEFFDAVKSSVDSEVVFQATLQVGDCCLYQHTT